MNKIDFYVESTTPNKCWRVSSYKPQGRPGRVCAIEGEVGDGGRSFTYVLLAARSESEDVQGNMTAKNVNAALDRLQTRMEGTLSRAGESWSRA